jgi:flagellar protein FliS
MPETTNTYLRDAVMTATPEQLQLMLFDGAIRFATQGRDAIQSAQVEKGYDLLTRAQRIVLEMHNGMRPEVDPQLCAQVGALHMFVYRKLVEANINKDLDALDDALRILRHQRETWVMLVDQLRREGAPPGTEPPVEPRADHAAPLPADGLPPRAAPADATPQGSLASQACYTPFAAEG